MDEDEEETVMSKNSPLYSYLLNNDALDGEDVRADKQTLLEQAQLSDLSTSRPSSSSNMFVSFFDKLRSNFNRILEFFKSTNDSDGVGKWIKVPFLASQNQKWRLFTIGSLLDLKFLDNDDEAVIRAEYEILSRRQRKDGPGVNSTWKPSAPYLDIFRITVFLLANSAYAFLRLYSDLGPSAYALDVLVIALSTVTGIYIYNDYRWKKRFKAITTFIEDSQRVDDSLRKSLKIIREYEVLAKGYTVVTKYTVVTNAKKLAQEDSDYVAPCIQLRKSVFLATEELFMEFREQTKELAQRYVGFSKTLDDGESFLLAQTDELREMFGDYSRLKNWRISLNVLHTCCYSMALQRSEFIRVYVLSGSQQLPSFSILTKLIKSIKKWEEAIRWSLVYYDDYQSNADQKLSSNQKRLSDLEITSPLYDYVRSLNLHLRSALEKTIEFEKNLADTTDPKDDQLTDYVAYHDQVELTLKKCQTCLDELRLFLDKSNRITETGDKENSHAVLKSDIDQDIGKISNVIFDGTEREIVDQVFEAFTIDNDPQTNAFDHHFDFENSQFNSGRSNVLNELKSVLTVRSSLMHERELRALASGRGVTVEEILAEEKRQQSREADENRKILEESKLTSSDGNSLNATIFKPTNFASELTRAFQLKGSNRKPDVVLGDDSSTDDEAI